ncbi:MAG: ribokinase, partial [Arthrobacter pascens]|nr:ribokinase [Arthrobacter pascens]
AVDPQGGNAILVCPGSNAALSAADVSAGLEAVGPGDIVALQLEVEMDVVRHAAAIARQRGATVVLNAAPAPPSAHLLFENVDVLVVNEHELDAVCSLTGLKPGAHAELTRALSSALGITVICTAGPDGAYAGSHGKLFHHPARRVNAVDTTGAGDTFVGYLAASLAQKGDDLAGALASAVSASASAVTRPGAMESIPRAAELLSLR